MKNILTPQEMKSADTFAIKRLHIPSLRLMERAGSAVVAEIILRIPWNNEKQQRVLVICGKGNNGGDGFVVARQLAEKKYTVTVVLIEKAEELQGDAKINFQRLQYGNMSRLEIIDNTTYRKQKNKKYDVIVDAMLGTAFRGKLSGAYRSAVKWCNKQKTLKIAVDIPTGLNGETGEVLSDAFRADCTITMSYPKSGFYHGRAKEYTGVVLIADIGIPKKAIPQSNTQLVETCDIQKSFPRRPVNSHKHSVGKVFVLAGSKSMTGAALFCSRAAMRSGAGQVILGIPESEYSVIAKRTMEVMPIGLPSTRQGSISQLAIGEIEQRIIWCDVVLIGCGMSRNEETLSLIREVIRNCSKPIVVDADGLNALIGNLAMMESKKNKSIVLTPHHGEFSRLTGIPVEEIAQDAFRLAFQFAKQYHVTLVLKGAPTVIAGPDGTVYVNPTGNPGMSTAGSGDVLAGVITALIGQGCSATKAAINGVYLHGSAGDHAATTIGQYGMLAGDILEFLPAAITTMLNS
ncbi:MAG: NAD(P)H-hydrate dehydratase [Bacteriovoracaceae bacterium]